ncbi:FAD-dependent oxidoreductase [Georgenia faecalis]|uniref:FAD-dependent oxidoreductase n=1 Tax=Georgenia faecalis TaxID=2483799 RepID=UPI000FD91C30|nr:FAD-dependent oxidoreductase [Georgenia faecalis]
MPQPGATHALPVVVIGAGPIGLAAAAHLLERGLEPLVLESGHSVGAAVRQWAHVRLFSPWQYDVDPAAQRLLERTGWVRPEGTALPTGGDLVEAYLEPLAATEELRGRILLGAHVLAVSRLGLDKTHSRERAEAPFLVRTVVDGRVVDHLARAVIDASGTWSQPNPLGPAGLPAPGEGDATPFLLGPLPDVLGSERERAAGRHVLVVGSGHSATNTLLALVALADDAPGTRITWAVRRSSVSYGGGDADGLPARGALGAQLREAVQAGRVELVRNAQVVSLEQGADGLAVDLATPQGVRRIVVDALAGATGFRPELAMLRELRLDLDPAIEAPRRLAPLVDPEHHSCGTVPAHGADVLAHPDAGFFIVGMKSYGRAPTFLLATGYEQVRSIAAHLAGDERAARELQLELPATGVCSATPLSSADGEAADACCGTPEPAAADACCGTPEPALLGFPTGLAHGRSGR